MPGVVIGHNADLAWGFTILAPDVSDFFLERVTDGAQEVDGEPVPLKVREEQQELNEYMQQQHRQLLLQGSELTWTSTRFASLLNMRV